MNQDSFVQLLESISEQILLLDPNDLPSVASVHTELQGVAAQLSDKPNASRLVASCLELLDRLVLREDPGCKDPINTLGEALASLLDAARSGEVDRVAASSGVSSSNPSSGLDGILEEFLRNQISVLEELEALVLGVERGEIDDASPALLRAFHTLKGESALLGLDSERLCHRVEDMLEKVPALSVTETLIEAIDWLGQYFRHLREGGPSPASPDTLYAHIAEQLDGEVRTEGAPGAATATAPKATAATATANVTPAPQAAGAAVTQPKPLGPDPLDSPISLRDIEPQLLSDFVLEAGDHLEDAEQQLLRLESDPEDTEPIHALFRAIHTIKGVAGMLRLDHLQSLAHSGETLMDRARHGELALVGHRIEVVFQTVDLLKRMIGELGEAPTEVMAPPELRGLLDRLDQVVKETANAAGDLAGTSGANASSNGAAGTQAASAATPTSAPAPATAATPAGAPSPGVGETSGAGAQGGGTVGSPTTVPTPAGPSAPASANADRTEATRQAGLNAVIKDFIKVDAARLDKMVDMIGELVIAESMVAGAREMQDISSPELSRDLGLLNKIIRELQEIGTSLRMIPVRSTFQKMARIVRDISKKTGKQIDFITVGEDTELDKSVVDKIGDPLVHMVRNAVDHGIESDPARRRAVGKSETGRVTLRAFHREGNICIEVADDGGGIDPARVLSKAVSKGIVSPDARLTESQIFMLIFEPGFSTAEQVTDVSGRGVGMDVVRRNIEALRGKVQIESVLGRGTTFTIQLPLTLAIIDGMLVRVGEDRFIIPTANVINSFQPTREQKSSVFGRGEMVVFHKQTLPLFHLRQLFDLPESSDEPLVIVLEVDGRRIGFTVDELLGHQQIVIKSLGSALGTVPGVTGGAVLPDGRIGLILDIAGLYKLTETKQMSPNHYPQPVAA